MDQRLQRDESRLRKLDQLDAMTRAADQDKQQLERKKRELEKAERAQQAKAVADADAMRRHAEELHRRQVETARREAEVAQAGSALQWECMDAGGAWQPYPPEVNKIINDARHAKSPFCEFDLGEHHYVMSCLFPFYSQRKGRAAHVPAAAAAGATIIGYEFQDSPTKWIQYTPEVNAAVLHFVLHL